MLKSRVLTIWVRGWLLALELNPGRFISVLPSADAGTFYYIPQPAAAGGLFDGRGYY